MILYGDDDEDELNGINLEDDLPEDDEDEGQEGEGDEDTSEDEETPEGDEEVVAKKGEREAPDVKSGRTPSRAETRIQKLANERREAVARAEAAKAELEALKAAQENAQRTQQQFAQQQLEQQRLQEQWNNAGPEDRVAMMLQKQQMDTQRLLFAQQLQMADTSDRLAFDALTMKDTVAAKYKTEVEARLKKTRDAGFNASREDIYKHLLGERILAARQKALDEQTKTGKTNIKRQTTKARRANSDRPGGRSVADEREARRKRLEGITF